MRNNRLIYRGLALLLCLTMVVGFVPAGIFAGLFQANTVSAEEIADENIVQNGGFDGEAAEWTASAGAQASVVIADGVATVTAAATEEARKSNAYIKQTFNDVKPYEMYELTAKYKWISGETKPYISLWFFKDKANNDHYTGYEMKYVEDQSGDWVTVTVTAVAPTGSNIMQVELGNNTGANVTYAFDDVTLVKKSSYTYAETFDAYNSGKAEEGPAGWLDNDIYNADLVSCQRGGNAFSGSALNFQLADTLWAKSHTFKVKAGYDYAVEFMAKKALNNGHFTGYAEIVFLDESGKEVGSYDRIVGKTYGQWTKESFMALAPEGAAKAYFVFACQTKQGAYGIDNLTVTESAAPSTRDPSTEAPEIPPVYTPSLVNPGFEEDLTGWTGYTGAGSAATVVTQGAYAGQKALQITAKPTEAERASFYRKQSLAVEGINAIEVSVMSKLISGDGKAYIMMSFYDEDNNLVPAGTAFMETIATSPDWGKTTRIQAVPKNAVSVTIEFGNSTGQTISYMVDEISVEKYTGPANLINPAKPAASSASASHKQIYDSDKLNNSFEQLDEYGTPEIWGAVGKATFEVVETTDAPNGKYVYQMTKTEAGGASVYSGRIAVTPGKVYDLKIMLKDIEIGTKTLVNFNVYDAQGEIISDACKFVASDGSGKWKLYVITSTVPENAASIGAEIWYSSKSTGCVQMDALKLEESDAVVKPPFSPSPFTAPTVEEVLEGLTAEHPRIYYTAEEGKQIKLRRFNTLKTKYGFNWYEKYEELLKIADSYLEMEQVKVTMNTGKHVMMDVYPVLRDPNDPYYDPIYIAASLDENGNLFDGHVWSGFGSLISSQLRDMMQTWCLAYTMSGKKVYAERAIDFALQVADWEWWGDYDWMILSSVKTDASMGWMTIGMASVYDVLYDLLTPEQREKIERSIIEKSLKPLSEDIDPMSTVNVNMMKLGGLLAGCAAIVSEDNIQEIKPCLDAALLCAHNALDNFAYSGNTEGHYYTDFGLESFMAGIGQIYRATHVSGLMDHPFFAEILPYWTVMWGAPANGTHPNYSDASVAAYMKLPMAVLSNLTDNPVIDGFLINSKGTGSFLYDLLYLDPDPKPTYLSDYAGVVEEFGYGVLRTGFASDDMMLTLKSNDSQMTHNHYDQNSIMFNYGGTWLLQDPGVGSYYYADRTFYTHNGHSTILVDGSAQMMMGTGSTKLVFNNNLYSYVIGTAPDAYGSDYDGKILDKFDRHTIQINHEDKPYYLIIDDLLSTKDRTYTWQMFNGTRQQIAIDGVTVEDGKPVLGSMVSVPVGKSMVNLNFVGNDQLLMGDQVYSNGDGSVKFGVTFTATATAAAKAHQFMTLLSIADNANTNFLSFLDILNGRRFTLPEKLDDPSDITWDSSMPFGQEIIKDNLIDSFMCLFFRGNKPGDYINIPFTIDEDGRYDLKLQMGVSTGCCKIKAIIDDTYVSDIADCSGWPEYMLEIPFGELDLAAGQHDLRMEIVGPGENEGYEPGWYLINAYGLDILRVGVEVPESKDVTVSEVYDTDEVLGGLINYVDDKYDLLMFNRTEGAATAGLLNTDGKQASALGIIDGKITEGFAVTGATTMTYDGKVLFLAENKVDIVASNTGWQVTADAAQTIQLTAIAPELDYVITVNGETVDERIENGLLTVALAEGENVIVVDVDEPEPTDPTKPTKPTKPSEPTEPTVPVDNDGGDATLWIIIGVVAAVLLAGAAVGIVLFVKKRKNV